MIEEIILNGTTQDITKSIKADISFTNKRYTIATRMLENGVYNSAGNKVSSSSRLRTINKIRIARGARISFTAGTKVSGFCYVSYSADGSKYFASGWFTAGTTIKVASETGFVAVMFKKSNDANISASEYDATTNIVQDKSFDMTYELEGGNLTSSDPNRFEMSYHDSKRRNKYPLIIAGNTMVMCPVGSGAVLLYDSTGAVLDSHPLSSNGESFWDIPSTAYYMDIVITQTDPTTKVSVFGQNEPYFTKRIYRNSGSTIVQDIDIEPYLYTCMAYKLPPNYSATGKPVPLVLWICGNNGYSNMYAGFPEQATVGTNYLRDEGYAVLQVFSWGSYYKNKYPNCGKDQPYPVPISLRCIGMGVANFIDRYNIDKDNIHIIGRSFGGQMGLYYALHPFGGLKSVTIFDPVIDLLSMRGRFSDARKALVEELSFNGSSSLLEDFYDINEDGTTETGVENYYFSERCQPVWEANIPALIRLNVSWNNLIGATYASYYAKSLADSRKWWRNGKDNSDTSTYNNTSYHATSIVPLKVVGASDDASTPVRAMTEKIEQLRNAGNPAESYFVPSGGHDAVSVDTTYAEDITTALGITCEDVPIGWIEAIKFMRKNS